MLVVAFGAREQALLPLYAVGVFISFTISQVGMVQRWRRTKAPGWWRNAAINAFGATVTGLVLLDLKEADPSRYPAKQNNVSEVVAYSR